VEPDNTLHPVQVLMKAQNKARTGYIFSKMQNTKFKFGITLKLEEYYKL